MGKFFQKLVDKNTKDIELINLFTDFLKHQEVSKKEMDYIVKSFEVELKKHGRTRIIKDYMLKTCYNCDKYCDTYQEALQIIEDSENKKNNNNNNNNNNRKKIGNNGVKVTKGDILDTVNSLFSKKIITEICVTNNVASECFVVIDEIFFLNPTEYVIFYDDIENIKYIKTTFSDNAYLDKLKRKGTPKSMEDVKQIIDNI